MMADHAVTQSRFGAASFVEPASKQCVTPLSQASTAPSTPASVRLASCGSYDFDDEIDDVQDCDAVPPEDLPAALLSMDHIWQSYFIDAKEEFVPDAFDEGAFDILSEPLIPSADARFSPAIAKPIYTFSSSRAEAACKGATSHFASDELAWSLLAGSPTAMSFFIGAQNECVKMRYCPDTFDSGVFELLSETQIPSEDATMRFSSCRAKPIHTFSSSLAEAVCKDKPPRVHWECDELALSLLSGSREAMSYFIGAEDECVKMRHCRDTFDWAVFELLSETQIPSEDTMVRFSPNITKPIHIFSSSQAEGACKDKTPRVHWESNEDLALSLLSGSRDAMSYFIGAQDEFVKTRYCPNTLDWGVFELLSETHIPSEDTLLRFSPGIAKPIHTFSSSRAEAACKGPSSFLESDELAWSLLAGIPAAMYFFIDAQDE